MTTIYSASWVVPVSSPPLSDAAIAVTGDTIANVGDTAQLKAKFPEADVVICPGAAIIPGLINAHSHLELTAMRGCLENEEHDFFEWLKKLTLARLEHMTPDDIAVSAAWGACEAARAGVTCVADASDSGTAAMRALRDVGLRGVVFQESFGPDPRLISENVGKLKEKLAALRELETSLVRAGVSPHAPYTVCAPQLEQIALLAISENVPLMTHAAESVAEELLLRRGCGIFADNLARRGIDWQWSGLSTIEYLEQTGILSARPLLAHCIRVDDRDLDLIATSEARIAHCPKSNAKLSHGRAPLAKFLAKNVGVGLGSDSVASNNVCDIIEESRFAILSARAETSAAPLTSDDALSIATEGGARCLRLSKEVGQLETGMKADLTIISLEGTHQQPLYDPVAGIIFSSSARDVVMTVVAGRQVFRDGRVTNVDEDRLRARISEIAKKLGK
ncbi:MAG: amidohydrolase family protein [Pyrinomonadaceae bacterium]